MLYLYHSVFEAFSNSPCDFIFDHDYLEVCCLIIQIFGFIYRYIIVIIIAF